MNKLVVGSIVVFNPKFEVLATTIRTFLKSSPQSIVYVWDNSASDLVSSDLLTAFPGQIHYQLSKGNYGYGRGHNENFRRITEKFDYFCVLNPDLEVPDKTISTLVSFLEKHPQYGLATGIIQGTDGAIHEVHKLLPSFWDYVLNLAKRFLKISEAPQILVAQNALRGPFSLPILSGCFMFFSREHYKDLHGFDDSFFLYFEDYDLSLRSYLQNKSIVVPDAVIIHKWARDSHKSSKLFWIHLKSGLRFYQKWGFGCGLAKKVNKLPDRRF